MKNAKKQFLVHKLPSHRTTSRDGISFFDLRASISFSADQELIGTILVVGNLDVGITDHAKEFRRIRHLI